MKKIIIAVDGPAGAGKGTVSKALSEEFNLAFMDTGALYRAVTYSILKDGFFCDNQEKAVEYAKKLGNEISLDILENPEIRNNEIANNVSRVASIQEVRNVLFDLQVNFAQNPPEDKNGSILDGRDIGTVICPDADVKLFITASAEVRAERRYKENTKKNISFNDILKDINERDERDMNRKNAPLKPAEDAIIVDTSDLNIEESIQTVKNIIFQHIK